MSDAPDLTPDQEAVRRLLAAARHDGPPPPEVVARLDDTLAELVAERAAPTAAPAAAVVDLGARRRRLAGAGVLAAAAVVVAGVALGQALPRGADDSAGSGEAASDSSSSLAEDDAGGGAAGDSSSSHELAPQGKSATSGPGATRPTLSTDDPLLEEQVEALRGEAELSGRAARRQLLDLMRSCPVPDLPRGRQVAAEVDGQPGVVYFERPDATSQNVAIYVCSTPAPVRTLTLPAP